MNRIHEILKKQGRTQIWLAESLDKSYNMVNSYVKNRRQPSLDILFRIASILEVDVRELIDSNAEEINFQDRELVTIPILGSASCGKPILAIENKEGEMPISNKLLKKGMRYFILRASGNSMNKAKINDGDLVLIRQQQIAENGQYVVALIDNEVTIKEFYRNGDLLILKPKSTEKVHQPIVLTEDFKIQGVVERVLK